MFFLAKMCPKVKDQEVSGQVSTTFSEDPQYDLILVKESRSELIAISSAS